MGISGNTKTPVNACPLPGGSVPCQWNCEVRCLQDIHILRGNSVGWLRLRVQLKRCQTAFCTEFKTNREPSSIPDLRGSAPAFVYMYYEFTCPFKDKVSHWTWSSLIWLDLMSHELQKSSCLCLPDIEIRDGHCHAQLFFLHGFLGRGTWMQVLCLHSSHFTDYLSTLSDLSIRNCIICIMYACVLLYVHANKFQHIYLSTHSITF